MAEPGDGDRPGERLGLAAFDGFGSCVSQGFWGDAFGQGSDQVGVAWVGEAAAGSSHQQAGPAALGWLNAGLGRHARTLKNLGCLLCTVWSICLVSGVWCLVGFELGFVWVIPFKTHGFFLGFFWTWLLILPWSTTLPPVFPL